MNVFGWVNTLLGSSQMVRTVHHFAMYYLMIFAIVHMYMVFREDIMSQRERGRHDDQRRAHVQGRREDREGVSATHPLD